MSTSSLSVFHRPTSVAVVGASDDPDKIGGRPLRYLREFGYQGSVFPVNPSRESVQGIRSFQSLEDLPATPDITLIAVPGEAAVDAVRTSAKLGVQGVVVFTSGFAETGDDRGRALQEEMRSSAQEAGMRIVGPNSQGLANFSSGAVLGFSTMFIEQPPADGPVAIVSQSGAMCSVPYGLLRRMNVGVRYAHATGNDSDVSVGELAGEVLSDPDIRLVLLYLEDLRDPSAIEYTAQLAGDRGVPVVALMGGRSADGQRAAASHTGALANEHRVVDAYLERIGIWRARNSRDLVAATELYLKPWQPKGRRLTIISNSGAVCVLAADAAADVGLPLSRLSPDTRNRLDAALPPFASRTNPIDVTAALLTDSTLVGKVLDPIAGDPETDACLLAIPVAGRGYDVKRFAADAAAYAERGAHPLVIVTPQPTVAAEFKSAGLVVFQEESSAVNALAQYLDHHDRMARANHRSLRVQERSAHPEPGRTLDEAESLDRLQALGLPVPDRILCPDPEAAGEAFERLGSGPVAVKGCSSDVTHKSELGLVRLGRRTRTEVEQAADSLLERMVGHGISPAGVLVMPMVAAAYEALIGAHVDPVFGPVVAVGAGGKYVEALPDVQLLLPPFIAEDALEAIDRLACAPILRGVRGEPPVNVAAWAQAAVKLGEAMLSGEAPLFSVDVNPLMVGSLGPNQHGAVAVDALVILQKERNS